MPKATDRPGDAARPLSPDVERALRLVASGSDDEVEAALNDLVALGTVALVDELARALEGADAELRMAAVDACGELPLGVHSAVVPFLVERVERDPDPLVRIRAACLLPQVVAEPELAAPAVPVLAQALRHEESWVREAAHEAIPTLRELELECAQLVPALESGVAAGDVGAAFALASIASPGASRDLALNCLARSAADGVCDTIERLGELHEAATPAVVAALCVALRQPDQDLRSLAAYTVGRLARDDERARAAVPALLEALEGADGEAAAQIATALGEVGTNEALARLADLLSDSRPEVAEAAGDALVDSGPAARALLTEAPPGDAERAEAVIRDIDRLADPPPLWSTPVDWRGWALLAVLTATAAWSSFWALSAAARDWWGR